MTKAFRAIAAISLALVAAAAGTAASAQGWPTAKPITMVVPVPPGPTVDMLARLVAAKLQDSLGQTVIVDNRSGANGMIGSSIVAHAAPDGYTLLAATPASHVTAVHLMKNLPVDPVKDFTPIMAAVEPVTALVGQRGPAGQFGAGADRLCQGQSGQAVLRQLRRRLGVPPDRRAVQPDRRREHHPRAVSRRRPADAGHRRGPHPAPAHLALQRAGRARLGQGQGARDPGAQALRQDAEHAVDHRDPSGSSASPRPGSASSGPRGCRRRFSRGSMPRCARPSTRRTCARRSRTAT